ncbi:MAG: hypothetical protein ABIX01_20845 [Chitinophagaceae bacterium]
MNCINKFFFITVLLTNFGGPAFSQKPGITVRLSTMVNTHKHDVFILCRGTRLKTSIISRQFNLFDSSINHVAVGFIENDALVIFNVSDYNGRANAIRKEDIQTFIEAPEVYRLGVWSLKVSSPDLLHFKKSCYEMLSRKVVFDSRFNLRNDDTLYCSEFSAKMLNSIPALKDAFAPQKKILDKPFYAAYLNRPVLIYYPVDFFLVSSKIQFLYGEEF